MANDSHSQNRGEHAPAEGSLKSAATQVQEEAKDVLSQAGLDREGPSVATVALVGAGVAILEPELIPGMLIGAGAWLAPKVLPAIGGLMRPIVKGVVRAGYSATSAVREFAAEAGEQVEDIVAEVRAEQGNGGGSHAAAETEAARRAPQRRQGRGSNRR